ncbi:MAG: NADPH:quinone oxidoreductase family protein [Alphaproteobacteria bacterium]|jgi:NADPH:quinone reductase|nr:NADPH:quinone oxidoreductase family protein [Alphaproteobacteria bacterium]
MRAMICNAWGGLDTLHLSDHPAPEPGAGQVLLRVIAAAVNYADILMVRGEYQTRPAFPFAPGLEAVGEVIECGEGVSEFSPGQRVMAFLNHGGFAEQALADKADCFAVPDEMSDDIAAGFLIGYVSSDTAIRWQGRLEDGETMLVLGAAGGVGLTAVEIGKAMGARVIAAASSAEKLALAGAHGADGLINYTSENLKVRVLELTDGEGADVCFDPVGGDLFDAALSSLGWGGRFLHVGFVGGIPQVPANRLLVKHRASLGSSLRYFRHHRPDQLRTSVNELLRLWRTGLLKPEISAVYPLSEAVQAMDAIESRRAVGKVVVQI